MECICVNNVKIKCVEGLKELEGELVFECCNICLNVVNYSDDDRISCFGIMKDNEGGLWINNLFLYDNVD